MAELTEEERKRADEFWERYDAESMDCPSCGGTGQPGGIMGGPEHGLCSYCKGAGKVRRALSSPNPREAK